MMAHSAQEARANSVGRSIRHSDYTQHARAHSGQKEKDLGEERKNFVYELAWTLFASIVLID